jgi:hypothetical protein
VARRYRWKGGPYVAAGAVIIAVAIAQASGFTT